MNDFLGHRDVQECTAVSDYLIRREHLAGEEANVKVLLGYLEGVKRNKSIFKVLLS